MTVTLKNQYLQVCIDTFGAQLTSVQDAGGTEYIWQADPNVWGRHAPLLFPFIGRLKDGQYTKNGQIYTISSHGFARDMEFSVIGQTETSVSFRLSDTPDTHKVYPYSFFLTVTYSLEGNRLTKSHQVENHSQDPMFYELGGHDGYCVPLAEGEAMGDYSIQLPGLDVMRPYGMNEDNLLTAKDHTFLLDKGQVALTPSTYGLDTIILDDLPQRTACLLDGQGHVRVRVDFDDFPCLGLWTPQKPFDTNFVCIEPWSSLPDAVFVGRGLEDKAGVRRLSPGGQETLCYTVTFFERSEEL